MRRIPNLILASSSPRRQDLLKQAGVGPFRVIPSEKEEKADEKDPSDYVIALSREKAAEVASRVGADDIVVAADTIVWFDGAILEKPKDENEAFRMLSMLSGNRHRVYTGVTVRRGERAESFAEVTEVFFRELAPSEIRSYIATGEPFDKAGGYGVQSVGGRFVSRIEGDYSNVVGLPVCRLCLLLREFGFDL